MNGNLKTGLSVLAGIVIGAVGALVATNPKAQQTMRNSGVKLTEHAKNLGAKVRRRNDDVA